MSAAIDCIAPVGSVVGEGPVWDERTGTLYWVDIKAPALYATDAAARQTRRWPMPAAAPSPGGPRRMTPT
jgi:sugar lactone lactonase YvrE